MTFPIGIRKEDKNIWEKRVPLVPAHVKELKEAHNLSFIIEPFEKRSYTQDEFTEAGVEFSSDLSGCKVILAVKEVPLNLIMPEKTYIFFSHTIKGQKYNMPLLQKVMDNKCTLIDYETMKDEKGRRVVFFGKYAGYAGMIDTLHGLGKRLKYLGFETPFLEIKPAYEYKDLEDVKDAVSKIAAVIKDVDLPNELKPLTFGFAGYGNVSKGAQEIFDILPFEEVTPNELLNGNYSGKSILKVVFKEEDMVEPVDADKNFELQEYYTKPENYKSKFEKYLPKLDVLINAIYWDEKYPRFLTKEYLKENYKNIKLKVIGDITCDINGAVEITYKATESDNPAFVYDPEKDNYTDGYEGNGIVDITVDNLPTELPRDASEGFSTALKQFVPEIATADYNLPFNEVKLPPEIKRAVIVYNGKLTEDYQYLKRFL